MDVQRVEEAGEGVSALIGRVEQGGELLITRNGHPVAFLRPVALNPAQIGILSLLDLRQQLEQQGTEPFSAAEVRALIDEGRKY